MEKDLESSGGIEHISYELPDFIKKAPIFENLRKKQDILNDLERMGLKNTDRYSAIKSEIRAIAESLRKISSLFFSPVRLEMIHILAALRSQTYYSLMAELSLARVTIYYHTEMLFQFGLIEKGEMTEVVADEKGNK